MGTSQIIQRKGPEIVCYPEVCFVQWFDAGSSLKDPESVLSRSCEMLSINV